MRPVCLFPPALVLLLAAACTFHPTDDAADGRFAPEFHPPLMYQQWENRQTVDADGNTVCVVTTGHNGLSIAIGKNTRYVEHTRRFSVGMQTTLRVNGHSYYTPDPVFPASQTDAILADLAAADRAYLEWSEVYANGPQRTRAHTILTLTPLRSMLKTCGYTP